MVQFSFISNNNSGGAWGSDTVQINLKEGASYTLKATATNSVDSATDSINLPWGCEEGTEDQDTEDTSTDNGGDEGSYWDRIWGNKNL